MENEKNDNNQSIDDIDLYLNTNHQLGLSEDEAKARQTKFGLNILVKSKKQNFFIAFIKSIVCELMSLLLFVTGIIGLGLAIYENVKNEPQYVLSYVQTGVLLSIVIINALFGTLQERKSSSAIDELEKMSSPTSKVLRDGKIKQVPSDQLTIGDIIIVEAGDTISADAILFKDSHLKISEAILTGESSEVLKDANYKAKPNSPIGDQKNKIFSGTNVLNGNGYGIVYAIGNNTEIGKIADLLKNNKTQLTPLQLKLQKLGKVLGIFGIIVTLLTFIFSLLVIENIISGNTPIVSAIQSSLLLAISLAAAAIPEGLSAIVTIVLSLGVKKMTSKNALIKKLPSAETLGSTSIICSDKTGTLTMNKMTIIKLWTENDEKNDEFNDKKIDSFKMDMLKKASLCSDGVIDETKEIHLRKAPIGDPTEIAILEYVFGLDISIINLKNQNPRIREIPFDSNRKLMSTINKIGDKLFLIVKGAPDVVISKCKNFTNQKTALDINNKWSNQAIRVLAVAQKEITNSQILPEEIEAEDYEFDLEFLGLIGMIDPPREEVKISINECILAGIKPIMITGDHLNTAIAIATNLGIIRNKEKDLAITGVELDAMSDEELSKKITNYSVYARVSPENKIRIVKAWQSKDQVVAMTGDGVNDAPALKAADIGCAMGITGTDVSKQASDMILMDDNFSTIVEAVKLGRNIYENIRRITKFLLSSNVTGVFAIVVGMFLFFGIFRGAKWGEITTFDLMNFNINNPHEFVNKINDSVKFETTITTIQILINHMVIETLPGVALGSQMITNDLMYKRPRSKYESIFADKLIWQILSSGLIHGIFTVVAYALGSWIAISSGAPLLRFYYGSTAAFITLTFGGILKSISMCTSEMVWKIKWEEGKWIYLTSIISLLLTFIVIFIPKLNGIVAEFPSSLDFKNGFSQMIENEGLFEIIKKHLSNNNTINNLPHYGIYLIGFGFGISTFILFECYKIIENKFVKKESKVLNKEFELVKRPLTWKEKIKQKNY